MNYASNRNSRWWGWGTLDVNFDLASRPGMIEFFQENFKIGLKPLNSKFNISEIQISDHPDSEKIVSDLIKLLGEESVRSSKEERILHSFGKSYKDLINIRSGKIGSSPICVTYPKDEDQIIELIRFCKKNKLNLIPFGGGTSVVGGVNTPSKPSIVANLTLINKVIAIDVESLTAEVEAGVLGPDLESALNSRGYTLGHFPQSFEFSTLGGWIAARSSGQNSILYGGIEKLVSSVTVLTPEGKITTSIAPRAADGPDLKQILIGSEGSFGIISKAHIKISKQPKNKKYHMFFFPSFVSATQAAQTLIQNQEIHPALVRVSDETETSAMLRFSKKQESALKSTLKNWGKSFLKLKGIDVNSCSLLLIGFEGDKLDCEEQYELTLPILKRNGGVNLGPSPGKKWLNERFFHPYLRDSLMDNKVFVETLETSTTWASFHNVHKTVIDALKKAGESINKKTIVLSHLSHMYPDGASLYFTIMAPQSEDPIAQWSLYKHTASSTLKNLGASPSHHHGIGEDHGNFSQWSDGLTQRVFKSIKNQLDPLQIMNYGKLISESATVEKSPTDLPL